MSALLQGVLTWGAVWFTVVTLVGWARGMEGVRAFLSYPLTWGAILGTLLATLAIFQLCASWEDRE